DPVQTQFGWHVIRLNDTRTIDAPEFDSVRGELEQTLSQKTIEAYIEAETAKADVSRKEEGAIDPALLKDISLLEQ
ncbi:MAG: peptidylprolyl isomerase, partial [Pseudomonadota bacterium]